jgi:hypothetical protein
VKALARPAISNYLSVTGIHFQLKLDHATADASFAVR